MTGVFGGDQTLHPQFEIRTPLFEALFMSKGWGWPQGMSFKTRGPQSFSTPFLALNLEMLDVPYYLPIFSLKLPGGTYFFG